MVKVKGIVLYSLLPLRCAPSEAAEQGTQLLFGETFDILRVEGRWAELRNDADGQTGWADAKMVTKLTEDEEKAYIALRDAATARVSIPMALVMSRNSGVTIPLVAGTLLTGYREEQGAGVFEVLGVTFMIDKGMVQTEPQKMSREALEKTLRFFLNAPYLWGGKGVLGMDCSGLTQIVMSLFGVSLLRNASEQVTQGRLIAGEEKGTPLKRALSKTLMNRAKTGDLAFFDHGDGKITHVGILLDKDTIVHCSGRVKVEKLSPKGIISSETNLLYKQGEITHTLHSIRRFA